MLKHKLKVETETAEKWMRYTITKILA